MSKKQFSDLNDLQAVIEELEEKISEQQDTISTLKEENEQLRQFINKGRRLSVKEIMDNIK